MAKILIIDDDKMVRDSLRMVLTAAGHQIVVANDGKQGVKAFTEIKPDLVITDILMPEKEGVETIGDIRKLNPKMPIIAMSGGGRVGNMSFLAIAKQFGASRTFTKPFDLDEVLDAVTELLKAA
jgi:two-component system, chemotaxis family, chemotaxis protein CheY